MAVTYASSPRFGADEYNFDEDDSFDFDDDADLLGQASDEDTEDASETDMVKQEDEFTEIKEQMYQDKLAQLKKQLQQLQEGTLPEYMKKLKKLDQQYKERLRINEVWLEYELELVDREFWKEKKGALKDFEEKKVELKENLILELEERKKHVEGERNSMELTGTWFFSDNMEVKPVTTRKLRRRPNDPTPVPEKRRKPSPAQLNYCLDEDEVLADLRIINKVSGKPMHRKPATTTTAATTTNNNNNNNNTDIIYDARIDDGRLYYDKRWFHRGQPVMVESKESGKVSAVITAVGTQEVWLRRTSDNGKVRVYVTQLQKGKFIIRRRSA